MGKKFLKVVLIVLFLLVSIFIWLRNCENNNYEKRGAVLIKKIETYRQIENRLPNTLKELGVEEPMNDGPYFEKIDSLNYKVFFNIGFDNSKVYYSSTKKWEDEP